MSNPFVGDVPQSLDREFWQTKFLYGSCHALTAALHELTSWPCVVFLDMSQIDEGHGLPIHSAVRYQGRGVFLDAGGQKIESEIAKRYAVDIQDLEVEDVTPTYLDEAFELCEDEIATAKRYALQFMKEFLPAVAGTSAPLASPAE